MSIDYHTKSNRHRRAKEVSTNYYTKLKNLSIGKKLQMFRIINELSQEELGEKLGYSSKTISAFENGERELSLSVCDQICSIFLIPKAFFLCGDNIEGIDRDIRQKMDAYMEKTEWNENVNIIINNCKHILEEDNIQIKKEYLPVFNFDKKEILSYGLFNLDSLPIKYPTRFNPPKLPLEFEFDFDSKKGYLYNSSALAKYRLYETLKKRNYDKAEIKDLKECDSIEIFKLVFEKMKNTTYSEDLGFNFELRRATKIDISKEYVQSQMNEVLEELSPELNNYWHIIAFLIENGAYYGKQLGNGDEITSFHIVKDISKTNLVYRLAKDNTKSK